LKYFGLRQPSGEEAAILSRLAWLKPDAEVISDYLNSSKYSS
jgi:hypothetical protein